MTKKTKDALAAAWAAFKGITLPQALVVIAMIAGSVAALVLLPEEKLEWVKATIVTIATLGTGGTLFLSSRTSTTPPPGPKRIRDPEDGSVGVTDLALLAFVLVGALIVVPMLSGCGGAIAAQSRAASVATVFLGATHRVALEHARESIEACADVACVDAVEASMAPSAAAHDVFRVTLVTWVDALQLALAAGDDLDVITALTSAAAEFVRAYPPLVAALALVGVDLPDLPPLVLAAAGGVQ